MSLEKVNRGSWSIKKSNTEYLKLTTTEHNRRLINLHISSTVMNMNYEEFLGFFDQLARIKRLIQSKYYNINENNPYDRVTVTPPEAPREVSILEPQELSVPEIYIITKAGALLFHLDISGKQKSLSIDKNLLSGLMSAMQLFAESLGWKTGINLVRAEDYEFRFYSGDYVLLALLSTTDLKLNHVIEPILMDFAKDLGKAFEEKFQEDLVEDPTQGALPVGSFDSFSEEFNEILKRYQTETSELYQKMILSEAIALDVPGEICANMIHLLSEGSDVLGELRNLANNYPLIKKAIERVNQANMPIWKILSIPIFEI